MVDTSISPYKYGNHQQMIEYRNDIDKAICKYALATNGRTLVLFMSHDELNRSYQQTEEFFRKYDIRASQRRVGRPCVPLSH